MLTIDAVLTFLRLLVYGKRAHVVVFSQKVLSPISAPSVLFPNPLPFYFGNRFYKRTFERVLLENFCKQDLKTVIPRARRLTGLRADSSGELLAETRSTGYQPYSSKAVRRGQKRLLNEHNSSERHPSPGMAKQPLGVVASQLVEAQRSNEQAPVIPIAELYTIVPSQALGHPAALGLHLPPGKGSVQLVPLLPSGGASFCD